MMKTFTRMTKLAAMACAMIPLTVACVDGTGPGTGGEDGGPVGGACDVDTDCEGDDFCHVYLKVCVANCVVETDACGDDLPVCNEEDANGQRPLDNADFNNVCVCDDTSCGAGQVCSTEYGVCIDSCDATDADACPDVDGEAQACYALGGDNYCQPACSVDADCPATAPFCDDTTGQCLAGCNSTDDLAIECGEEELCDQLSGECFGACVSVGEQDTCLDGEVCVPDGTCEEECDDDICLNAEQLCQYDATETETYNQCVAPADAVDTDCGSIVAFAADVRDDDGPILIFGQFEEVDGVYVLEVDYFDPDGDMRVDDNPAQYGVDWEIACDDPACIGDTFPPDDSGDDVFEGDATSGTVYLIKSMPEGLEQVAVQALDAAANTSNAVCLYPAE